MRIGQIGGKKTAFHSAVRVSLHSTALRVFRFLFAVSGLEGQQ